MGRRNQHPKPNHRKKAAAKAAKLVAMRQDKVFEDAMYAERAKWRRVGFVIVLAVISDVSFRLYGGGLQQRFESELGQNLVGLLPAAVMMLAMAWALWPRK